VIDHDQARRWLSSALDGELEHSDESPLRDHLDACASCQAYQDRLARVRVGLRDASAPAPDVRAAVMAAIGSSSVAADELPSTGATAPPTGEVELHVVGHRVDRTEEARPLPSPRRETTVVERRGLGAARVVRWLPAAACLVVGLLIGSALVGGLRTTSTPAAAQVPEHIAAAQFDVVSRSARIEMIERGWNEQVPERTFTGSIDYRAPETLALHLDDTTVYPSPAWVPDDVDLVRRDLQWWARGPRDCPSTAQPGCTAPEPRLEVIDDVEPHDDGAAMPLDLVVPVRSFLRSTEPTSLGARTLDGHEAVGVEVSAAQVAPLLDGLRPAGNLRQFFPSDVVGLWLDAERWTPLLIEVRASDDVDRRTWATNRGYVERPGDEILSVRVVDRDPADDGDIEGLEPAPAGGVRRDAGFAWLVDGVVVPGYQRTDARGVGVDGTSLPHGIVPMATGIVGFATPHETVIQTWSGGRGWVKVASTTGWDGTRLFGDLGSPVRRLTAADGSVTYASLDGTRYAVHANGVDVVVTGSVDEDALARVVDGLDVVGVEVPADWDEAATETIASATDLLPGLLVPAPDATFDEAAVRADGNVVTQAYAGAGGLGFVVVEAPGERLPPPLDMDVSGVVVRGIDGRYSAARGELEWVEGDRVHRITSTTLTRVELLAIARAMVHA
jgi:hypothetical protein